MEQSAMWYRTPLKTSYLYMHDFFNNRFLLASGETTDIIVIACAGMVPISYPIPIHIMKVAYSA